MRARCLRSRRRSGFSQADLSIGRSGDSLHLRRIERGRNADTGAGHDTQDDADEGYSIRLVVGNEDHRKAAVESLIKGLASGALKPVIDRTFKFDDMVEVHRYLESSEQFGKI